MKTKRHKFERKAARVARKSGPSHYNPASTPPPSPEETTLMQAGGVDVARGNSDQMPLSSEGQREAQETAQKLAAKGGLDNLDVSTSARAEQTAEPIIDNNPTPITPNSNPALEAQSLGGLEGEPDDLVRDQIRDMIRNNPMQKIPGKGAMSSRPGESFDDWRLRYLPAIRGAMQTLASRPDAKLGILTHSSGMNLTKAWLDKNAPDDFSVNLDSFDRDRSEAPAAVSRLFPDEKGNWQLSDVNLDDKKPMEGGIYMIRHAPTPWNKQSYDKTDESLRSLAQITKHTRALDFQKVQDVAKQAASKGHLTDNEITSAIDNALPSAEGSQDLPHDQLMAVASAASPAKRAEYEQLMRERFAGITALPKDSQRTLAGHLGRIGMWDRIRPNNNANTQT